MMHLQTKRFGVKSILMVVLAMAMMPSCMAQKASKLPIEPANVIKIEAGDSPEQILAKAAHVIPTNIQYDYLKREFIAFIHWGPNAFSRREWGTGQEDAGLFNPAGLDTDQWCEAMKAAGIRLVVLVAKHHDGYCLWPSRYTQHSVKGSPWMQGQGNVMRSLSDSCKKYGLQMGFYLSPADLSQMDGGSAEGYYGNKSDYRDSVIPTDPASLTSDPLKPRSVSKDRPVFKMKLDDYNRYFANQLYELLTEYGPIHEIWFDGANPKPGTGQEYRPFEWQKIIRTLAPEAAIYGGADVRWCGNEGGFTRPSEWNVIGAVSDIRQGVDPTAKAFGDVRRADMGSYEVISKASYLCYMPAEVDTSIRAGWFYRDDTHQKVRSTDDVFDIYERAVGGNAVFMLNIPPNRKGRFSDREVQVLRAVGERIRRTYGTDLLEKADSTAPQVLDGDLGTCWLSDAGGSFEISMPSPILLNRFVLQEEIAGHGQRVEEHALDAWLDGQWQEIARGTTVGYKKILRFAPVTTQKLRVRILKSRLQAGMAAVSAHYYLSPPPAIIMTRDADGHIVLDFQTGRDFSWKRHNKSDVEKAAQTVRESLGQMQIRYTLDGTDPTADSLVYDGPFPLADGGHVKACAVNRKGELGAVTENRYGMDTAAWTVVSVSSEHDPKYDARKAFDGDPATFWHTSWKENAPGHPHHLAIDLGRTVSISGFSYLPRQDKAVADAMIEQWRLEVSADGKSWTTAEEGTFGNLLNDPSERVIWFDTPRQGRYIRLVSLAGVQGKPYAGAAEIQVFVNSQ